MTSKITQGLTRDNLPTSPERPASPPWLAKVQLFFSGLLHAQAPARSSPATPLSDTSAAPDSAIAVSLKGSTKTPPIAIPVSPLSLGHAAYNSPIFDIELLPPTQARPTLRTPRRPGISVFEKMQFQLDLMENNEWKIVESNIQNLNPASKTCKADYEQGFAMLVRKPHWSNRTDKKSIAIFLPQHNTETPDDQWAPSELPQTSCGKLNQSIQATKTHQHLTWHIHEGKFFISRIDELDATQTITDSCPTPLVAAGFVSVTDILTQNSKKELLKKRAISDPAMLDILAKAIVSEKEKKVPILVSLLAKETDGEDVADDLCYKGFLRLDVQGGETQLFAVPENPALPLVWLGMKKTYAFFGKELA